MARQNMIRAVNKELRTFPDAVRESATAELARQLAREFDAGDRPAAGALMRALDQLRKLAAPAKTAPTGTEKSGEEPPDELDELARARADRLAAAAGVVRPIGTDERRRGGRQAR